MIQPRQRGESLGTLNPLRCVSCSLQPWARSVHGTRNRDEVQGATHLFTYTHSWIRLTCLQQSNSGNTLHGSPMFVLT